MKTKSLILVLIVALHFNSSLLFAGDTLEVAIGDTVHLLGTYQLSIIPTSVVIIEHFGSIPDYVGFKSDSIRVDENINATMYFSLTLIEGAEEGKIYNKSFSYMFLNSTQSQNVDFSYSLQTPIPLLVSFTADYTTGNFPFNVQFTSTSTGTINNYQWDFGDSNISNEQNPSHIYEAAGTYTVSLIISGPGGADTLTLSDYIKVTNITGIESNTAVYVLNIYPNPARSYCTVSLTMEKPGNVELMVYNSQGQMVREIFSGNLSTKNINFKIDVSGLPTGLYYISINKDGFNSVQKLLIAR